MYMNIFFADQRRKCTFFSYPTIFFSYMYVVCCTLLQNSQHFYAYMNILTYIHPSICMGKN